MLVQNTPYPPPLAKGFFLGTGLGHQVFINEQVVGSAVFSFADRDMVTGNW